MNDAALKPDTQDIVGDEVFPHTPETIWKTLTTANLMGRWRMMPAGFTPGEGKHFTSQTTPAAAWAATIHCQVLGQSRARRSRRGAIPIRNCGGVDCDEKLPGPGLQEYERHRARILSDLPEQGGGEAGGRSEALGDGRRQREREDARLLPRLRVACLSDLLGHAGPLHHSRREPRRSTPIRAADGDVHGARSCLGPAHSPPPHIPTHSPDVN